MKRVLSTRNLSNEIIAFARSLELEIQCVDFIKVESVPFDADEILKNDFDSIVFTSSNAVQAFAEAKELMKAKNIFSISGKTNDELLKMGIHAAGVADNAEALADKIIAGKQSKSILHPCGNLSLDVLKTKMSKAQIEYHRLIVYKTHLISNEVKDEFDAVLFFSPSGVESFFMKNNLSKQTLTCCIGDTTAKALQKKHPINNMIVADSPSPESMLKATANYFKKSNAKV